eukprot:7386091-Prymnesium_polylepis.1
MGSTSKNLRCVFMSYVAFSFCSVLTRLRSVYSSSISAACFRLRPLTSPVSRATSALSSSPAPPPAAASPPPRARSPRPAPPWLSPALPPASPEPSPPPCLPCAERRAHDAVEPPAR